MAWWPWRRGDRRSVHGPASAPSGGAGSGAGPRVVGATTMVPDGRPCPTCGVPRRTDGEDPPAPVTRWAHATGAGSGSPVVETARTDAPARQDADLPATGPHPGPDPDAGTGLDQQVRRAVALAELSRLMFDGD